LWFVAKEESESYIMTNYHVISDVMQRRRQTQREIKVHILIRAALYPLCIIVSSVFQVPDAMQL
jgi:hypothetical protein